jgi:hypothetical protein
MSESINKRLQAISSNKDSKELRFLYTSILTDLTEIKTTLDVLVAKMNLDAGITDADYASMSDLTLLD